MHAPHKIPEIGSNGINKHKTLKEMYTMNWGMR
jgi:hypothetical protein